MSSTTLHDLLPVPGLVEPAEGRLELGPEPTLGYDDPLRAAAQRLQARLREASGLPLRDADPSTATLRFVLVQGEELPDEGFELHVERAAVTVRASTGAGACHAVQAILQLLGPQAFRAGPMVAAGDPAEWSLPCGRVVDAPRFAWRGVMLDVARHFLPKPALLRFVDLAAMHRLNRLHLHLTDDQGWRMEVRRYPRLTSVGGWREGSAVGPGEGSRFDATPHGGYYTQADLREVVAYAAARGITVVPEIDLPGHSQAAIAAYPELGNLAEPLPVWTRWGINENVLSMDEAAGEFFGHVLDEVLEVFPGALVHLGGDEVPVVQLERSDDAAVLARRLDWEVSELPHHFLRRLSAHLRAAGRTVAMWDEALEDPGLDPSTVVFAWRGADHGIEAARRGHQVVMCPEQSVYLDHRQSMMHEEPVPVGWSRTWQDVYAFELLPAGIEPAVASRILGAQANVWTEHLDSPRRVDYATFPRLCAFADAVWRTGPADLEDFTRRLHLHLERLDALGVEYRPLAGPQPWQQRPGVPGRDYDAGHAAGT